MQDDFDLSPTSEANSLAIAEPGFSSALRKSNESLDSSKCALTDTELSDWAENGFDPVPLDLELNLDSCEVGAKRAANVACPQVAARSRPTSLKNIHAFFDDDIEFADRSEGLSPVHRPFAQLRDDTLQDIHDSTVSKTSKLAIALFLSYFSEL